jgi:hypothetical protein
VTSRRRPSLLADLALLIKRHPSREWFRLAALLENNAARTQIVSFLKDVAASRRPSKQPIARTKEEGRRETVLASDENKQFLSSAKDDRERLELELGRSSIRELREIAKKYKIPFSQKDSRHRLIRKIALVSDRASYRSIRPEVNRKEDRSDYERWAEIIIRGNRAGH